VIILILSTVHSILNSEPKEAGQKRRGTLEEDACGVEADVTDPSHA